MSMLFTNNNVSTTLTAPGAVPLGSAIHGYGKHIVLNNNALTLKGVGYFKFLATVNAEITAAGPATVTLLENGNIVSSVTITATEGANVEFVIPWTIRKSCCCNDTTLSLAISTGATITNVSTLTETERD